MASSAFPTILMIPGAFHRGLCYQPMLSQVEKAGFPIVAATLPSCDPKDPETATAKVDVDYIRATHLEPLIDKEGKDVIMIVHSYGGAPGGAAALGWSKTTRAAQGKAGGIIGLVYMTSGLVPDGESILGNLGVFPPVLKPDTPGPGLCVGQDTDKHFYNDMSAEKAAESLALLLPHSVKALFSPPGPPAWKEEEYNKRRLYLRCLLDNVLPIEVQDGWINGSGVDWATEEIQAGHSPFLSQPVVTGDFVVKHAKIWMELK